MSNCIFGTPIYSDANSTYTPAYSGGTWSSTLTLANLSDRRLSKVARSSAATLASTQFDIDLGVSRGIRVFAIPRHTMSLPALIRFRGSNVAGNFAAPVYDSGWLDVYGSIYPTGTLVAGHPSFTTRELTAEELAEQRAMGINYGFTHVAAAHYEARYWRVEVDDTTNSAGYVDLARLVLAAAWQPTINMAYGAKLGYETSSTRTETDGGASVYQVRPRRRTLTCLIEHLPEDEAMVSVLDVQKYLGTTKQLYFIFDPADTSHLHRRSFLAVQKELSPLDFPYSRYNTAPFALIEEL